ncbi:permease [Pseudoduganella buxea]|uniref:Permease n=1 Tax=Pseudoduganella buxea TaxID=1949069 RepID=A0A6I3SUR9_9BURK|nr:permease [Pseudoduganella buxea]MTV52376.1 permease [Pseudoduganella buxea]GGC06379.1 hypothetical protein GCM10011572_30150 [Pseudoduganella buxea]
MQRILMFDLTPPLALPMRFFLTVPAFALLAAGLLLWQGEAALATRWSPVTLALTHLLTLGCLCMAMIGALLQILPVMAGIAVAGGTRVGRALHGALCAGTLLLAAAFLAGMPLLFAPAMLLLGGAFLLLIGCCTVGLWQQFPSGADASLTAIRLALAALAVTVVLGLLLAAANAWPGRFTLPLARVTDLHAMWGLFGWTGLLVIGVAFQVVPMFLVTECYPRWLTGSFATALFLLLVTASLPVAAFRLAGLVLLGAGYAAFACATLFLLARRKRPAPDAPTLFWHTAMASLLAALATGALPSSPAMDLLRGVLLVAGFALSTINGMLYKIVPFLARYHARHATPAPAAPLPAIHRIIPDARARFQYLLHLAALALLAGACGWPALLARPAAVALAVSCIAWWLNLVAGLRACGPGAGRAANPSSFTLAPGAPS